ncbi:MAG: RNA polymerase sigma factor [Flavobacteriaceae bacterium]|nr:RNA polymerase sigma factor [Flavobacteriaceae bacterium]
MNQKEIIQQCKKNDYTAQLAVYNLYKNMLYNSCYRILKSKEDAEDCTHDTFIKGFQKIQQVTDDIHIGAWLRRIAINTSLDKIRKEKNTFWAEESKEIEVTVEEIEIEEAEEISIDFIKECINQLKEKYRIIVVLYLIENYTHREIAELLNLNESTVRNQYVRGKSQLASILKEYKKDELKRAHSAT